MSDNANEAAVPVIAGQSSLTKVDLEIYREDWEFFLSTFDLRDVSHREKALFAAYVLEILARGASGVRHYGSISPELVLAFVNKLVEKARPNVLTAIYALYYSAQYGPTGRPTNALNDANEILSSTISLCRNVEALPGSYMFRSMLFAHLQRISTIRPELGSARSDFLKIIAAKRQQGAEFALQRRDPGHMDHLRERDFYGHEKRLVKRHWVAPPSVAKGQGEDATKVSNADTKGTTLKESTTKDSTPKESTTKQSTTKESTPKESIMEESAIKESATKDPTMTTTEASSEANPKLTTKNKGKAKLPVKDPFAPPKEKGKGKGKGKVPAKDPLKPTKGKGKGKAPAKDPFERPWGSSRPSPLWPLNLTNPNPVMSPMDPTTAYAMARRLLAELEIERSSTDKEQLNKKEQPNEEDQQGN